MAEDKQPPGIVEGATAGDVEDEVDQDQAKSAEDRKAAAALSKLDARGGGDEDAAPSSVDREGLNKAMNMLSAPGGAAGAKKDAGKKMVKVDAADVALLVSRLFLSLSLPPFPLCCGTVTDCVGWKRIIG
jgi:hypothetical protein